MTFSNTAKKSLEIGGPELYPNPSRLSIQWGFTWEILFYTCGWCKKTSPCWSGGAGGGGGVCFFRHFFFLVLEICPWWGAFFKAYQHLGCPFALLLFSWPWFLSFHFCFVLTWFFCTTFMLSIFEFFCMWKLRYAKGISCVLEREAWMVVGRQQLRACFVSNKSILNFWIL